jgi:hypothetical protein
MIMLVNDLTLKTSYKFNTAQASIQYPVSAIQYPNSAPNRLHK